MELLVYPAIFFLWRQRGLSGPTSPPPVTSTPPEPQPVT